MNLDYALFDAINQGLAHPWLDAILPIYREKTTWIPLYLVMLFLLFRQYGWRSTLYLLLAVGVALTVADQLAASVLKPLVGRLRPCAEPSVADHARILIPCGGRFGFPSNHATNHFALATLLSLTWLRTAHWGWRVGLFLWAASISLAQVYVGKHYPADILCGAVLGGLVAWGVAWVYGRISE